MAGSSVRCNLKSGYLRKTFLAQVNHLSSHLAMTELSLRCTTDQETTPCTSTWTVSVWVLVATHSNDLLCIWANSFIEGRHMRPLATKTQS